ncbi:hypothetical protein [Nonomuraea recticatena]|uniref:hypothetical protein n=1 Tax=Nonomuraea recticatena TaxID=46178 RepID=UPI00360672B9
MNPSATASCTPTTTRYGRPYTTGATTTAAAAGTTAAHRALPRISGRLASRAKTTGAAGNPTTMNGSRQVVTGASSTASSVWGVTTRPPSSASPAPERA